METLNIHPFERTIGQGPYTVVDLFVLVLPSEANQGRNNFALAPQTETGVGSCAHCGTGIIYNYIVKTGDGKRYAIGSNCIEKCGLPARELSKVKRAELKRAKKQRVARKAKKGDDARDELKSLIALRNLDMGLTYMPNNITVLSYASWCLNRSSDGGIVLALNRVKKAMGIE